MSLNKTDPKPSARGGQREGAGRKPLPGDKHTVRRALLSDAHVAVAKSAGAGNMSAGIRKALEYHSESVALFTTPSWGELLGLFEALGTKGREMRCQKVDGSWYGQVYDVEVKL